MTRARRHLQNPIAAIIAALALAGCVSTTPDPITGRYATPIGGAPVISNETPYSRSLTCLANYGGGLSAPRIAVGQIADYTGKIESDGSGRKITQGASLMAISALSKAGVRLVERFDTGIAELELKYANNKLIGEDTEPSDDPYRKILAGSIPGSDFYLVGGITELNFNIRSAGLDAFGAGTYADSVKGNFAAKAYVMNIGLDLRLINTKTLEVVDVISYQKQIVGREIRAGVFDILGTYIIDVSVGDSALEPIQLAVRAVIERAVLEIVSGIYRVGPNTCQNFGAGGDPLGTPYDYGRSAYGGGYSQTYSRSYTPAPTYGPSYSRSGLRGSTSAAPYEPARSYDPARVYSPSSQAYPPQTYSPPIYSPQAYPPQAYPPQTYPPQAYPPQAYSPYAPAIRGRIEPQTQYGYQETYYEETRNDAYRGYSTGEYYGGTGAGR